jgi:pyrroloquinoline quinone biosynthesis protein E
MSAPGLPYALLAELTHRCPLGCPYCSNPLALSRAGDELTTDEWRRVIDEAASLGVLQIHFSGGEPTARRDLAALIGHATSAGLYGNLITSAVLLDVGAIHAFASAGLRHVQISFQDSAAAGADRIGAFAGGHARKLEAARLVRAAGLALTVNLVVHRQNLDRLDALLDMAVALGAQRIEVAHVQYHGWAFANRAALMPTRAQVERAGATVAAARERLKGIATIDYVAPDYYARRPKPCMGGWARQFLTVAPDGAVLPCQAARSIEGLSFESVRERGLADIWEDSPAFERFRGTGWMPEPCRGCDRREIDWGGCRCQAFALTGDAAATDPACALSPDHAAMLAAAERESAAAPPDFVYRRIGAG